VLGATGNSHIADELLLLALHKLTVLFRTPSVLQMWAHACNPRLRRSVGFKASLGYIVVRPCPLKTKQNNSQCANSMPSVPIKYREAFVYLVVLHLYHKTLSYESQYIAFLLGF
jgi:predicted glycosyltransferase